MDTSGKRKPGRPAGTTKAVMAHRRADPSGDLGKAAAQGRRQERIISRHRSDCHRLADVIKTSTPGTTDAKDIGALARATNLLHEMERRAYEFGNQGAQAKTVIIIPMASKDMEEWHKATAGRLGSPSEAPGPADNRRIEPDIEGEPPPDERPTQGQGGEA